MKNIFTPVTPILLLSSILVACGGGGSGGDNSSSNETTNSSDVTSTGTISRFGSVYVNGVRYDTSTTQVINADDGSVLLTNPSNAQLKAILGLGQVITVRGTRDDNNGVASSIIVDNELIGEVTSVSSADVSFVVLGQLISVTPETIIDDSLIETVRGSEIPNDLAFGDPSVTETLEQLLPIGTLVEVSGFPTQNGFEATRIEDTTELAGINFEAEVKGTVSNLTATEFTLNGLTVLYDTADLDPEDFNNIALENSQFVEVHGTAISATTIDATRIELEDRRFDNDFSLGNSGKFEIEGIIQSIQADASGTGGIITINGFDIHVDNISGFVEGIRIEIKGTILSDGSLSITRVKDESKNNIRIDDQVISADLTSFTTRLGLTITPTIRSRLEDDTIEDDDNLSVSDFLSNVNGQYIEARGFPLGSDIAWSKIEIEDDNKQECRLRGRVANISGDATSFSFTIEGITINSDQVSDNNFESGNDVSIGRSQFFAQLNDGDSVQAKSDKNGIGCTDGELIARELEFEPEDNMLYGSNDDDSSDDLNDDSTSNDSFDNEIVGTASNITATSFDLAGLTITVNDNTLIDDSLIESALGFEVENEDSFGNLNFTLGELISNGMPLEVIVDRANGNLALSIEDR